MRFELYYDWNGDDFPAKEKISDDWDLFASWCATAFLLCGREHEAKGVQRVVVWSQGSRGVIRKRRRQPRPQVVTTCGLGAGTHSGRFESDTHTHVQHVGTDTLRFVSLCALNVLLSVLSSVTDVRGSRSC